MSKLSEILDDLESLGDGSGASHAMIDSLKKDLKMLIPEWMSIDEFLANPTDGIYHVISEGNRLILFYRNRSFWTSQIGYRSFVYQNNITHVQPVYMPEAPK